MATVKSKIIVRKGDLINLPVLDSGEQGYASDARRLFIGNDPIIRTGDGATTDFNFTIDLGTMLSSLSEIDAVVNNRYEIRIDGALKQLGADYNIIGDGQVVSFVSPPSAGSTIQLRYNTELLTYIPDRSDDPAVSVQITGFAQQTPITEITINPSRYDIGEIDYTLKDVTTGFVRKGKISLSLEADAFSISDSYNTNNESALPHVFNGSLATGAFVLNVSTTTAQQVTFSFKTNFWKS